MLRLEVQSKSGATPPANLVLGAGRQDTKSQRFLKVKKIQRFYSCLGAFVVPPLDSAHRRDSESGTKRGFSSALLVSVSKDPIDAQLDVAAHQWIEGNNHSVDVERVFPYEGQISISQPGNAIDIDSREPRHL